MPLWWFLTSSVLFVSLKFMCLSSFAMSLRFICLKIPIRVLTSGWQWSYQLSIVIIIALRMPINGLKWPFFRPILLEIFILQTFVKINIGTLSCNFFCIFLTSIIIWNSLHKCGQWRWHSNFQAKLIVLGLTYFIW